MATPEGIQSGELRLILYILARKGIDNLPAKSLQLSQTKS